MLRSSSLIGSWFVNKEGRKPIAGWKVQVRFWIPGEKKGDTWRRGTFLPCFETRNTQPSCKISGQPRTVSLLLPAYQRCLAGADWSLGWKERMGMGVWQGHTFSGVRYLCLAIVSWKASCKMTSWVCVLYLQIQGSLVGAGSMVTSQSKGRRA